MTPYFAESFANPHSADHALGWQAAQAVEAAASQVAELIGADDDEIIFTSGATESNTLALIGLARRADVSSHGRLLVSAIEHKCVLAAARAIEDQLGLTVEYLPVDGEGRIKIAALEEAMDSDVLAVSVMAVNNEIGTVQDIKRISEVVRRHGAAFHCDAAQAPCAMDLKDVAEFVDLLSLSAHKMYGPKGIGALYAGRELHDRVEPIIYGGGQQQGLRSGTVPAALCVGMGVAAELFRSADAECEREHLRGLRDQFVLSLKSLQWPVILNGPDSDYRHPGNASVCFQGFSAHEIIGSVQPHLAASTGSACTSGIPEPSHVLRAIGLSEQDADASIRFSLGRRTVPEDLDEAIGLIDQALGKLARTSLAQSA